MSLTDDRHDTRTRWKKQAAQAVLDYVSSGMVVGLGTGSTAIWAVRGLAACLMDGRLRDVRGIPTSQATAAEARRLKIPLTTLEVNPVVDLTIDGADEVDPDFNLIKGGGGALLHEKIVARASRQNIIVVDETKLSDRIGARHALPVEVVPFGWRAQQAFLETLGADVRLRLDDRGAPFRTDSGHVILDGRFGPIADPAALAHTIKQRTGVVEHGLFLGLVDRLVVAGDKGIRHLAPGLDTRQWPGQVVTGKPANKESNNG